MNEIQIKCITKSSDDQTHEAISHIGDYFNSWTISEAISLIQGNAASFYTLVNGNRADIRIVKGKNGLYLQTLADGKWNDNLLALPRCH